MFDLWVSGFIVFKLYYTIYDKLLTVVSLCMIL
jgi:hypothetical protein